MHINTPLLLFTHTMVNMVHKYFPFLQLLYISGLVVGEYNTLRKVLNPEKKCTVINIDGEVLEI